MPTKILPAKHRLSKSLMTLAVLLATTAAPGQESSDEQRLLLDAQQAQLTQRLNRLDTLGAVHGRYVLIRDTYLYGPSGIAPRAATWYLRADAWVAGWTRLLAFFDAATSASLAQADVQDGIRTTLKTQQDDWMALRRDAGALARRAVEGRAALAKIERLPDDYVPRYDAQIHALNAQLDVLDAAFIRGAADFETTSAASWDQLTNETQVAVLARLRQAMLHYPELQRSVQRVDAFFRAERELGPIVHGVHRAFDQLRDHLLAHRIYHADDALVGLRAAAATAGPAIDATQVDTEFADPVHAELASLLTAGEQLYRDSTRNFSHAALVAAYKNSESRRLAALCRDMQRRKTVDCDLLRVIAPIKPEQILAMVPDQLRYIEFGFDQIAAGPLR